MRGVARPRRGREISRSGATHFCQQRQRDCLKPAVSGLPHICLRRPHFFHQRKKWGKNAAKNQWFLDFLPPLAGVFCFVRNVELTYFSERCRFYSEMRRCAVLHFGRSAAAGINADQFHISGGLHLAASAWDAERQSPMCGARADFQTAGLNGVFGHFCRCWQKWVAPERETSP